MRTLFALAFLGLSACGPGEPGYQLVAIYDAAALATLEFGDEPAAEPLAWTPDVGMQRSCGPARAPAGFGVMEAEAMATGQIASLVLLIAYRSEWALGEGPAQPLTPADVHIEVHPALLGKGQSTVLKPAVVPRGIAVRVAGDPSLLDRELVHRSVVTALCLEHWVGRAWEGTHDGSAVSEAFLQGGAATPLDERFFLGQDRSVAPMLGPPASCECRDAQKGESPNLATSAALSAAEMRRAQLPPCERDACDAGVPNSLQELLVGHQIELGEPVDDLQMPPPYATTLQIEVTGSAEATVRVGESDPETVRLYGTSGPPPIADLVSRVPHHYPTFHPELDPDDNYVYASYTALVIPSWQLLPVLGEPAPDEEGELRDPVGVVLANPAMLEIRVKQRDEDWEQLNPAYNAIGLSGPSFGYPVDSRSAQGPVVLLGGRRPVGGHAMEAHRTSSQSAMVLGLSSLGLFFLLGLPRLVELVQREPELRLSQWSDPPEPDPEPAPPEVPS